MKNLINFTYLNPVEDYCISVEPDSYDFRVIGSTTEYLKVAIRKDSVNIDDDFDIPAECMDSEKDYIYAAIKHSLFNEIMQTAEEGYNTIWHPLFLAKYEDEELLRVVSIPY